MEKYPEFRILVVDDEENARVGLQSALLSNGVTNVAMLDGGAGLPGILARQPAGIVLLDLVMPGVPGEELLARIKEEFPETSVIVITGRNEVGMAVKCMRLGAYDYLVKPVDHETLLSSVNRAIQVQSLLRESAKVGGSLFKTELECPAAFKDIVTRNPGVFAIFKYVEAIAPGLQSVLISGETGTGKELVAKAIHQIRGQGTFIPVNIAEFDATMVSDALFGHLKGAYTGADSTRPGLVESANGGTLFLDEIGELGKDVQVKLLRLLQEREYVPLGADMPKVSTARVVAATNQNLEKLVTEGRFRKDLYFRLKTHKIDIPPLRERRDDISLLLSHFVSEACREFKKPAPAIDPGLPYALMRYDFPGNIRELRSMVFDAVGRCFAATTLSLKDFPVLPLRAAGDADDASSPKGFPTLKEATSELIREALRVAGGNQSAAAKMLGISHQALNRRLNRPDTPL